MIKIDYRLVLILPALQCRSDGHIHRNIPSPLLRIVGHQQKCIFPT